MKNVPRELIPAPDIYSGGFYLSESVCVLFTAGKEFHLFDSNMRPICYGENGPVIFKSFDRTPLKWAVVLKGIENDSINYILNVESLNLTKVESFEQPIYAALSDSCLHIQYHVKGTPSTSNDGYVNYAVVFNSGKIIISFIDFFVSKKNKIIIERDLDDRNGCYSFDGSTILEKVYEKIELDDSHSTLKMFLEGKSFIADLEGHLLVQFKRKTIALPHEIVECEKISDSLYKVAQFGTGYTRSAIRPRSYGLYDISLRHYIIPCHFSSLTYVSNSIIIVCGNNDNAWGIIDIYGGQRIPMSFEKIQLMSDGMLLFQGGFSSKETFYADLNLTRQVESSGDHITIPAYYEVHPFFGKSLYYDNDENIKKFYRGFCIVSIDNRYGIVDSKGYEVISCVHDYTHCVCENEKQLFIATYSEELCGHEAIVTELISWKSYSIKCDFIEDYFKSDDGALFLLTSLQKKYFGLYGITNGRVFPNVFSEIRPIYDVADSKLKKQHHVNILALYKEKFGAFALAKLDGTVLTDFKFQSCFFDKHGYLICKTNDSFSSEDGLLAIFDRSGNCVVPLESCVRDYEVISEDWIKVYCQHEIFGYVVKIFNKFGVQVTNQDYSYIGPFNNEEAIINIGGKVSISQQSFYEKQYVVSGGLLGVISSRIETVIEPKYSIIRRSIEGLRVVAINNDMSPFFGLLTSDGKEIIRCKYRYLGDPCKGQLRFAVNGQWSDNGPKRESLSQLDRKRKWLLGALWGIIDRNDNILVPASYQHIYHPIDDVSIILNGNKYGFYSYKERILFVPQYDYLSSFSEGLCVAGIIDVSTGEMRYGYINKKNHVVIDFKYLKAGSFQDGSAEVETQEAVCVINRKDEIVQSREKTDFARLNEEADAERERAIAEEEDYSRMVEDGLKEAFNGDFSNMWNTY